MPHPAPGRIGGHEVADALGRLHGQGVLACQEAAVGGFELLPQAVHVHGVGHHGVVVQDDAHALAEAEVHWRALAEFEAVELPGVALHVAREVEFELALGAARVERAAEGVKIGEREGAAAGVAEADAGVIEVGARHVHPHVGARAVFAAGVVHGAAGHGQGGLKGRAAGSTCPCFGRMGVGMDVSAHAAAAAVHGHG